jgi:hypothetical protein
MLGFFIHIGRSIDAYFLKRYHLSSNKDISFAWRRLQFTMKRDTRCPIHGNAHPGQLCPDAEKNRKTLEGFVVVEAPLGQAQATIEAIEKAIFASQRSFSLSQKEAENLRIWLERHDENCRFADRASQGAAGGRLSYTFTPTGIGCGIKVGCACGEKVDVTDYDSW